MKAYILSVLLGAFCIGSANAEPVFGRYVGVLRHEGLNQDQLAKLDFIISRDQDNEVEIMAILTLHFGDFKSAEYVTYHYDNVRFNISEGTVFLSQDDQSLSIRSTTFNDRVLIADVHNASTGKVGQLFLELGDKAELTLPSIAPLWGEYRGNCETKKKGLQLYTFRSNEELSGSGTANPFAAYEIRGQEANTYEEAPETFVGGKFFASGSYDFFRGDLTLTSRTATRSCKVKADGLTCVMDGEVCFLQRVSNEISTEPQFSFPSSKGIFSPPSSNELDARALALLQEGEYRGYVYHEYLDQYQAASLTINLLQLGRLGLKLSATGRLYFGENAESISYQFGETFYPPLSDTGQIIVLRRPEKDVDAAIHITAVEENAIRGVWYSLIFGRVGEFELRKDAPPELPNGAYVMQSLKGNYESTYWNMDLNVRPSEKGLISSENPFFPNVFSGHIYLPEATAPMIFSRGTYDFYTGRIAFVRDRPYAGVGVSSEQVHVGMWGRDGKFSLKRVYVPFFEKMLEDDEYDSFRPLCQPSL